MFFLFFLLSCVRNWILFKSVREFLRGMEREIVSKRERR